MKKILLILIPIAIALIVFLIIYGYYNKENKNTSLTVNEKRWVEKNKDTEVSFEIVNDYPVYAMNGQGVLFDFIEDFEKNVGLEFDENPYQKTVLVRKRKDGTVFKREIGDDSTGIGEYFAWAIQIFKVVYKNKCLIADEVDRVLNPVLSDRIVSFINGNKHTGQFIFTTHNVLHLDLKNYMKEQIYFATKDKETLESELYSLADFPEVRYEVTKIYEFYMKGILGGVANE